MINFKEAKQKLKPYINKGTCNDAVAGLKINEALERIIDGGKWKGTICKFAFCHEGGCLTMPREVESILGAVECSYPLNIQSMWYAFQGNGWGQLSSTNKPWGNVEDRGDGYVTQFDLSEDSYLRVYTDLTEATGSKVLIQGYDDNGNRVQTNVGGEWIDGEYVSLNGGPNLTTTLFSRITGIQFHNANGDLAKRNGYVRIYAYDGSVNTKLLGIYHPNDEIPSFRRYYYPGYLGNSGCGCSNSDSDSPLPILVLAKIRFVEMVRDTDILPISSIGALKNMCQALYYEENENLEKAQAYEAQAIRILNNQLKQYQGGMVARPKVDIPGRNGGYCRGSGPIRWVR